MLCEVCRKPSVIKINFYDSPMYICQQCFTPLKYCDVCKSYYVPDELQSEGICKYCYVVKQINSNKYFTHPLNSEKLDDLITVYDEQYLNKAIEKHTTWLCKDSVDLPDELGPEFNQELESLTKALIEKYTNYFPVYVNNISNVRILLLVKSEE